MSLQLMKVKATSWHSKLSPYMHHLMQLLSSSHRSFSVVVILKYQLVSSLLVLERETKHTYTCIVPGNNMSTQFPSLMATFYVELLKQFQLMFRSSMNSF